MQEIALTLPDERRVVMSEHGDPDGFPVFLFHGTPGARIGRGHFDAPANARAVRLLEPDRPGLGDSSGPLLSSIAAYAHVVAAMGDALGIERFGVMGWSSGGPFALACGAGLPDRVSGVATIGGVAPVADPQLRAGLTGMERRTFDDLASGKKWRAALRFRAIGFAQRRAPGLALAAFKRECCGADRRVLDERGEQLVDSGAAAYTQGVEGVLNEYRIWAADWGFDFGDLRAPVHIWHGSEDTLVPVTHAHALAAAVPDAVLHLVPGEGHISMVGCLEAILDTARTAAPRPDEKR